MQLFNKLLNSGQISFPEVQCFAEDGEISPDAYCTTLSGNKKIDPTKLDSLKKGKLTIRISNLAKYNSSISNWAQKIEAIFGCPVHINAYYTNKKFNGLKAHYDPHHLFAVQIYGQKKWELGEVVINNPSHQFMPEPNVNVPTIKTIVLEVGEMIYLPPGLWHQASTPQRSLHLTIGLHPPRWEDYLFLILKKSSEQHPIYRSYLPLEITDGIATYIPSNNDAIKLIDFLKNQVDKYNQTKKTKSSNGLEVLKSKHFVKEETLDKLYDSLWKLLKKPKALYLRGSYKTPSSKYIPWDIDIYAVVEGNNRATNEAENICKVLEDKYPNLPNIDLSILPLEKFKTSQKYTLKRILFHYDAIRVQGIEVADIIPKPPLNPKTADLVKKTTKHFLYHYYIKRNLADQMKYVENTGGKYFRSIAKGFLRSGTFILIRKKQVFVREINKCYKALIQEYPELKKELSIMKTVIGGNQIDLKIFDMSARKIFDVIYCR